MSKKRRRVRIFSIWRLLISAVLGFILPLSYSFALHALDKYIAQKTADFLTFPFFWPRPLWIFFMGRQPTEDDLGFGLLFMAISNIVLYGTLVYVALSAFQILRQKPAELESPPTPQFPSDDSNAHLQTNATLSRN